MISTLDGLPCCIWADVFRKACCYSSKVLLWSIDCERRIDGPLDLCAEVLHQLTAHRLHRVYTVDEELRPIGLVTCTDVLRMILKEAETTQDEQTE